MPALVHSARRGFWKSSGCESVAVIFNIPVVETRVRNTDAVRTDRVMIPRSEVLTQVLSVQLNTDMEASVVNSVNRNESRVACAGAMMNAEVLRKSASSRTPLLQTNAVPACSLHGFKEPENTSTWNCWIETTKYGMKNI